MDLIESNIPYANHALLIYHVRGFSEKPNEQTESYMFYDDDNKYTVID